MIKFGTGGWRGIIADEFTKHNLQIVCTAIAHMMISEQKEGKGMVIGYDRRFLSRESALWAAEVFAGHGILTRIIDREAPTPLVMFAVTELDLDYGCSITASHNPAIYNGLKLFTAGGRDANQEVTEKLEGFIERVTEIETLDWEQGMARGLIEEFNPLNEYIDSILDCTDVKAIKKARLKVGIDPMFGVSKNSLRTILSTARCEVEVIHGGHDALFGGKMPTPTAETMGPLSQFVLDQKCDIGVATDGDADRIGVINEKGDYIDPNQLMVLLYYYLLKYRGWQGDVVRNVSTTHLLDRVAEAFGQKCHEVPVGFKHISAKMEETDAIIGGESSGGLTVKGHIKGKDGIYAAVLLVEIIAVSGLHLSDLYQEVIDRFGDVKMFNGEFDVGREKESLYQKLFVEKVTIEFPEEVCHISYLDGCKFYFASGGWLIARFSGTEPVLRIAAELRTRQEAQDCVLDFARALGAI